MSTRPRKNNTVKTNNVTGVIPNKPPQTIDKSLTHKLVSKDPEYTATIVQGNTETSAKAKAFRVAAEICNNRDIKEEKLVIVHHSSFSDRVFACRLNAYLSLQEVDNIKIVNVYTRAKLIAIPIDTGTKPIIIMLTPEYSRVNHLTSILQIAETNKADLIFSSAMDRILGVAHQVEVRI